MRQGHGDDLVFCETSQVLGEGSLQQLGACLQSSPPGTSPPMATGRRGVKVAKHSSEEARPQSCLVGSAIGRPGGEGSPSPKNQESSLKHRLFRSMFLSTPATGAASSSKPVPLPQNKVYDLGFPPGVTLSTSSDIHRPISIRDAKPSGALPTHWIRIRMWEIKTANQSDLG